MEFPDGLSGCRKRAAALAKRAAKIEEEQSAMYAGMAEFFQKQQAAENRCRSCHWCLPENMWRTERTDGRFVTNMCNSIGDPCWHYWEDNQEPPETCETYCKKGEYEPTGIWAEFANAVREVAKMIDEKNPPD